MTLCSDEHEEVCFKEKLIKMLCHVTYAAWRLSLSNTNYCTAAFNAMSDIKIGDLVMEISAIGIRKDYNRSIGYVLELGPSKYGSSHAVKLKLLINGETILWDNCDFVRVPYCEKIASPFDRLF
jgi:hypothetical protein